MVTQRLYQSVLLTRKIELSISDIGVNLDNTLYKRLVHLLEGKCGVEGYFKKGSIVIKSYSSGQIVRGNKILYDIVFKASVCMPVEDMILKVKVVNLTNAGIKGEIDKLPDSPLVIYIMRDHFNEDEYFNSVKVNDTISVRVIGQRHEINNPKIYIIGELIPK